MSANNTTAANHPAPPGNNSREPVCILIVDDNEINLDILARTLKARGYNVQTAQSGSEALDLLPLQKFDLVLLDIMMHGMSGLQVLEKIRSEYSPIDLPVIMVTALNQSHDIVRAFELGASDYVTKPIDLSVTLARVQTHISLRQTAQIILELEKRLADRNAELEVANAALVESAERTHRELQLAARIQRSFLPRSLPKIANLEFAWTFKPCQELAGDSLNIFPFDAEHVGLYVLDVAGHGVAASLLAVSVARVLSVARDSDSLLIRSEGEPDAGKPLPPVEVADRLNKNFAPSLSSGRFLTFLYMILNPQTRALSYVSAGHPGAIRVRRGTPAKVLEGAGMPIGVGETYQQQSTQLEPGDRLYLYTDGVTEAMNPGRDLFGLDQFKACLERGIDLPLKSSVEQILKEIDTWSGGQPIEDDISILAFECT